VYACWEWGFLRVLKAWGRLGLIRLPPYGSRHLHDRTLTHPPTVLPAAHCGRPLRQADIIVDQLGVQEHPCRNPTAKADVNDLLVSRAIGRISRPWRCNRSSGSVRALKNPGRTALTVIRRQAAFPRTHGTPVQGTRSNGEK